ncbi:hypothetical protein Glove_168g160 [Diversispora epigaea]|uniref:Uncharacterized protein n=1 Tax=Diversispora epigaea TaxID=1348612 RepID=A0A397ISW5_9GLOM|nr:hypothetical protein Glove_168g160 [Diversispora epigaea]
MAYEKVLFPVVFTEQIRKTYKDLEKEIDLPYYLENKIIVSVPDFSTMMIDSSYYPLTRL